MTSIFEFKGTLNPATGSIGNRGDANYYVIDDARDGLDAVFFMQPLNHELDEIEKAMKRIVEDGNPSDTQRQFQLQQLMNTWSTISQGMTNMLKAVSDANKAIVRNIE